MKFLRKFERIFTRKLRDRFFPRKFPGNFFIKKVFKKGFHILHSDSSERTWKALFTLDLHHNHHIIAIFSLLFVENVKFYGLRRGLGQYEKFPGMFPWRISWKLRGRCPPRPKRRELLALLLPVSST